MWTWWPTRRARASAERSWSGRAWPTGIGLALGKPVVGILHLEGHLLSPLLAEPRPEFPFIALLVSGGHTQLMRVDGVGRYALLGRRRMTLPARAFDKTATLLGSRLSRRPRARTARGGGNAKAFDFPRPMLAGNTLDFSFTG
jgi:N6-L-threonylcarbamoyladenine synthase